MTEKKAPPFPRIKFDDRVDSMKKILTYPFLRLIKFYQMFISPLTPATCRFQATCSQYAKEAWQIHGLFKGGVLAVKRIFSCHPWGGSG